MPKYGIAISTYFGENTSPRRINILLTSIYSLISSNFDGKIVVVDDCSETSSHLEKIQSIDKSIQCIKRTINNGLSRCKNTCIKNLLDCEYLFLADDDNIYNGDWWSPYINSSISSGIPHFSHYTRQPEHGPLNVVEWRGVQLKRHNEINGNFLFATNKLISEIGGFKIMPYKYGYEHTNFTLRCLKSGRIPFFCDIFESEKYIQLNTSSLCNKSMRPDSEMANKANQPTLNNPRIYEPIEE